MSVQVEKLEKNMAKLTIEVSAEEFEAAVQEAYLKNKGQMQIPGFRKGKAPRKMIEKMYGASIFYDDAVNAIIPVAYEQAANECGEILVSQPSIDLVQVEAGKPMIFTAEVAIKPEVTLGQYKGVTVPAQNIEVTDEEIEADLKQQQENNSRTVTVERAIENGDIAVIDFEGFVDGVAFDGGKGENYSLEIGSHSFVDTFEDQLIGKNAGDELDVNVTFPEQYAPELAGKAATFKVAVKEVKAKELPALDDEFAADVSEFDTLDEYKASIRERLAEKKADDAKRAKEDAALKAIIDGAQMEIPEAMVTTQQRQMLDDFAQRMQMQGLSMEMYTQFTGQTPEMILASMKDQALERIQARLVLEAVAKAENIEATDEDLDAEIAKMAEQYKMEAAQIRDMLGEAGAQQIKEDLAVSKAAEFISENAVEAAE